MRCKREHFTTTTLAFCQQSIIVVNIHAMATPANTVRKRNNSSDDSRVIRYTSRHQDNTNIGRTPSMTASSPPHNIRIPRGPPLLFTSLGFTGWEEKRTRTWFRTILLAGLQRVRDGGYDTEITWKKHNLDQKAKALSDFKAYIKQETGYFCTSLHVLTFFV